MPHLKPPFNPSMTSVCSVSLIILNGLFFQACDEESNRSSMMLGGIETTAGESSTLAGNVGGGETDGLVEFSHRFAFGDGLRRHLVTGRNRVNRGQAFGGDVAAFGDGFESDDYVVGAIQANGSRGITGHESSQKGLYRLFLLVPVYGDTRDGLNM